MTPEQLCEAWLEAKSQEDKAIERRREIEDQLCKELEVPEDLDGTSTYFKGGPVKLKVVGRIARKVDADLVQELAAEFGLTEHLSKLFRWKPELNMSVWNACDASITSKLSPAITARPGRPSFSITKE